MNLYENSWEKYVYKIKLTNEPTNATGYNKRIWSCNDDEERKKTNKQTKEQQQQQKYICTITNDDDDDDDLEDFLFWVGNFRSARHWVTATTKNASRQIEWERWLMIE